MIMLVQIASFLAVASCVNVLAIVANVNPSPILISELQTYKKMIVSLKSKGGGADCSAWAADCAESACQAKPRPRIHLINHHGLSS